MAGAVGAGQPAGHLGAKERRHADAQSLGQGRQVKTGEMEHLLDSRIFQQQLELGRSLLAPGDADATGVVVIITKLHQAEPVPAVHQSHGFGIYRQGPGPAIEGQPSVIQIAIEDGKAGWGRLGRSRGGWGLGHRHGVEGLHAPPGHGRAASQQGLMCYRMPALRPLPPCPFRAPPCC